MYLSIFDNVEKEAVEGLSIDPASLYCAFAQVKDGRKAKGKRYPLPLLLTLLLLGKLAGETGINGIVDWVNERAGWLRRRLHWPRRFPTNSTYSEALARCDAQQIATVIAHVLLKARAVEQGGSEPGRLQASKEQETLTHVAMDGKTLRSTLGHESETQPSVHLLSLYECHSGIVLTQRAVRMAGAPEALAALNGGVLALMDWLAVSNVASQMRHLCAHPEQALQLLCGKLIRQNG